MKVQSTSNTKVGDFDFLTPDIAVAAAEAAIGKKFTGFASVLPSYINRVYELEACDRSRFVIKFYRPGDGPDRRSSKSMRLWLNASSGNYQSLLRVCCRMDGHGQLFVVWHSLCIPKCGDASWN